jgi:alpha-L-fucosidase 2
MFMNKFLFTLILAGTTGISYSQHSSLRLWYNKPAQQWEETLPLGNGRLGMMPDGGVSHEKIVLNDITLWSGSPQDANNYNAYTKLPEIRKLIIAGKNDEAQVLVDRDFVCTGKGSADVPFGCYQTLGDLDLDFSYNGFDDKPPVAENYTRELSLQAAVAGCSFRVNGVTYRREYFTSFDDDLSVVKISADQPGQLNCKISLSRPERSATLVQDNMLVMTGQLDNGTDGKGMKYKAIVKVTIKDGSLQTSQNALIIKNATEIILYISAATDFRNASFEKNTEQELAKVATKTYEAQKQNHTLNYQKFFNRVNFSLTGSNADDKTTDERLNNFLKDNQSDKGLPVLFFQFGRYLSISSTRVGLLPPNLQGLWANQIHTPWNGDYHLDINVQMNQWPVEVVNLSEFNLPLTDLVRGLVAPGERTAKAYYHAEGWVAHVITNVWGFTEPGESASWGSANSGSGWLCNNLWDHYAFTLDKQYLKSIYPILKGSAQFYSSVLVEDPKTGWLVTSPSVSPENAFYLPNGNHANICMGPTIDQQITRELFNNVITAATVLGDDEGFKKELQLKLRKIPPAGRVGSNGSLMEWLEDYKEVDPHHRHISHLYGLYPSSLITPLSTPDLALAARKTLETRGDDGPSWSIAFKQLFWARLQDGNRSYKLLTEILKPTLKTHINYGAGGGVYPNLLSAGPPFQIDGNFGATAGIGEMLIQSHQGFIELIPAIPDTWKEGGDVSGLKARGNFVVDMKWKDGKITTYTISSSTPSTVKVKVNGVMKEIMAKKIRP